MRTLPRRRYIYRDPDTGREFMCWRGEALDRILRSSKAKNARVFGEVAQEVLRYGLAPHNLALVLSAWRHRVRLRAPLANP